MACKNRDLRTSRDIKFKLNSESLINKMHYNYQYETQLIINTLQTKEKWNTVNGIRQRLFSVPLEDPAWKGNLQTSKLWQIHFPKTHIVNHLANRILNPHLSVCLQAFSVLASRVQLLPFNYNFSPKGLGAYVINADEYQEMLNIASSSVIVAIQGSQTRVFFGSYFQFLLTIPLFNDLCFVE